MEKIVGKRIILRKASLKDFYNINTYILSDESIAKYMLWEPIKDLNLAYNKFDELMNYQNNNYFFVIALKASNELIGYCEIKKENENIYYENGIVIIKSFQNKGYGKETLSLLLDFCFDTLNAKEFDYYCVKENNVSKMLAKHFKFNYISTEKEVRHYDKKILEIEKYCLTKSQYKSKM